MNAATLNRLQRRYDGRAPIFRFPAVRYTTLPEDIRNNAGAIPASGDGAKLSEDKSGNSSVNVLCLNGVAGNYASAPSAAPLNITGDIDFRARIAADDWSRAAGRYAIAKYGAAGTRSYLFGITNGRIEVSWSADGTAVITKASTASPVVSNYGALWIRATIDVDNGAAGNDVKFYTSPDGVTWTQLGTTVTTAGVTSIFSGASVLTIGQFTGAASSLEGLIYRAQIYAGLTGSDLRLDANFATAAKLAPSFTESSSNAATVTINTSGATGARISGARDLYQGTAANQPIYLPYSGTNYGYLNGVSGNWFSTPDSVSAPTGDIDIQLFIAAADWTPAAIQLLCDKWGGAGQRSWTLRLNTAGTLSFFTSADGTASTAGTSSVAPTVSDGGALWIRVTRASGTGAIIFYTGGSGATPTWVQLGTSTSNTAGAIFDSTATVTLGADSTGSGNNFSGLIYYASISSSIGGAAAIAYEPSRYTSGTTFTASTGEVWTINGGATIVTKTNLYFDGSNDYLKAAAFSLSQPETVYFVGSQVTWTSGEAFFDGNALGNGMAVAQNSLTPALSLFAGTQISDLIAPALNTRSVISAVFSGAASFLRLNRNTAASASVGVESGNGFTLGCVRNTTGFANITASEVLVYSENHDEIAQQRMARDNMRRSRIPMAA